MERDQTIPEKLIEQMNINTKVITILFKIICLVKPKYDLCMVFSLTLQNFKGIWRLKSCDCER